MTEAVIQAGMSMKIMTVKMVMRREAAAVGVMTSRPNIRFGVVKHILNLDKICAWT